MIGIYYTQAEQPTQGMGLQGKEEEKDEKHIRKLIRKSPKIKGT